MFPVFFFFLVESLRRPKISCYFEILVPKSNQPAVDRFSMLFNNDSDSMPRVWTGKEDIRAITKTARTAV